MGVGNLLHFVEHSDYATAGDQPAHRIEGNLTVEAWVRTDPVDPKGRRGIITKLYTDGGSDHHGGYGLIRSGGSLLFYVAGSNLNVASVSHCLQDNEWHHVAGVYDGTSLKVYVDGVRRTSRVLYPNSSPPVYQPNTELLIGRYNYGPDHLCPYGFGGTICEARVWSRARTQAEIAGAMSTRLSGSETDLVGYWPLDEGEGSVGQDLCEVAPLTLYGATWQDSDLPFKVSPGLAYRRTGWASTTSMLSAALESLNRASALSLLEQLIDVLNAQDTSQTAAINQAKSELGQALATAVEEIKGTTTSLQQDSTAIKKRVDTLEGDINAHLVDVPNDLDRLVTSKLDAQNEAIVEGTTEGVVPQIEGVFDQIIEDKNVAGLSEELTALQKTIDEASDYANSLSTEELDSIAGVINDAIMAMDLAPIVQNALISVNGSPVRLNELAQKLAAKPEVADIELSYDNDDIRSAVFTFDDSTKAVFTATRIDLPNLDVHYRLKSVSLRGLPAEFEMRFKRTSLVRRLGDSDVVFEEFEPVYQSKVLYSIAIP